jgi:hypothetical protein
MQKHEATSQQLSSKSQDLNKSEEKEISNSEFQKLIVRIINELREETYMLVLELKEDMNKQLKELKENSNK